jgi:hypothetical protein
MIDQIVQFAVGASAAPVNVAPAQFNPIPADGFIEVWAVLDELGTTGGLPDAAALLSVTLGGATPYQPTPPSAIRVNVDGVQGAGPSMADLVMGRQGVRQGTNFQLTLQGGTNHTQTGRFRTRFTSVDEVAAGSGAIAS